MRVANLNMLTNNVHAESLHRPSIQLCGRRSVNCGGDSVTFTTYGGWYQQVCGRVRVYFSNDCISRHCTICGSHGNMLPVTKS